MTQPHTYRRAYCPTCRRHLSITRDGKMRRHVRNPGGIFPPVDCPGTGQDGTDSPDWTPTPTSTGGSGR
ncbi:hypothetical protein GCM10010124_25970 [Pilimelia terevasa]|uniref:Uncharacterized protein n=1 Tax=Pilimelia terevasa TaxID=53372 RepID=A0A8J3FI48_9ACTN|nr:hypothetical protein [Pilimelia terevasa]GGK32017.1 hypothetical protein GCM10010124_25970 [Pilimelia terevasa]